MSANGGLLLRDLMENLMQKIQAIGGTKSSTWKDNDSNCIQFPFPDKLFISFYAHLSFHWIFEAATCASFSQGRSEDSSWRQAASLIPGQVSKKRISNVASISQQLAVWQQLLSVYGKAFRVSLLSSHYENMWVRLLPSGQSWPLPPVERSHWRCEKSAKLLVQHQQVQSSLWGWWWWW